ncbi:MAG TPA: DUF504 domain-containing protein [Candidatus Nanoarchaeia archaeon]|nr:DUF504 domain-containing protein [Candidatus Nanoarchaeia archaeon]
MMPIHELISKIKWDPNEKPADYFLSYYDRILKSLIEFRFDDIASIEDSFIQLYKEDKLLSIPFHRIKQIKKDGKIVWERKVDE